VSDDSRGYQESNEDARRALAELQVLFRNQERLAERADVLEVASGSSLALDRQAAPYNSVPDLVYNLLGVALDHLHGLQVSVEGSGGALLAMSSFTLIRSAIEAAGTGLWILQPEDRDERLLRSRRLIYDNRRQVSVLQTESGQNDPGFRRSETRLRLQLQARPSLAHHRIDKLASVTSRLRDASESVPQLSRPPLSLWRIASGIAHGNHHMGIVALERKQKGFSGFGGSTMYEVTSSYAVVAEFYGAAIQMIDALIDLYDDQNVELDRT
jgi:hypothetical protein